MGGAENLTLSIIKNDQTFNHTVMVLNGYTEFQKHCEDEFKINFINLNFKTSNFFSLINWKLLISAAKKNGPQVIQSYMYDASKYGRILALIMRIPILIYIVNTYSYKKIRRGFFNYFFSFITYKIIVNSEDVRNDVVNIDKVGIGKIYLLESFANLNLQRNKTYYLRRNLGIKKNDYLFLFIARLVEQKGIDYLIEAMDVSVHSMKKQHLKLIIVGDGELMPCLIEKIINHNLAEHIYLVGEDPNLDKYLSEADAYIDSSIRSGLSVAAINALGASLPAIMTDVGGVRELTSNGKFATICPPADIKSLASAMAGFIDSKKKNNMGASQFVKNKFSDVTATKKIINLYKEALKL